METLAQYQARIGKYRTDLSENKNNAAHYFERAEGMTMFVEVAQDEAKEIEASARLRGAIKKCIANLDEYFETWKDDAEDGQTLMICLNNETGPFPGKITDSLYTSFNNHLKNRKDDWRLIKSTPEGSETKYLYVAHL